MLLEKQRAAATSPVGRADQNFQGLPEGWQVVKLSSVVDIFSGGTPSKRRTDWWAGTVPWVSPKDLKRSHLAYATDHISEEAAMAASKVAPAGTVLIVVRGMILAKDVPVALTEVPMAFNQDLKALVPRQEVSGEYLLYALEDRKQDLRRLIGTSAHGTRRIGSSDLESLELPLPPKDQQRAIVQVLNTARKATEARRRELELERERRASLSDRLFSSGTRGDGAQRATEHGMIPERWRVVRLASCAQVQTGMALGRRHDQTADLSEVPYLRVANVQDGYLDLAEVKTVKLPGREIPRYALRHGDVVLTEGGDFDKLGRGFVWLDEIPGCIHQNHVFAVRVDVEQLLPHYLAYLTNSNYGRSYFLSVAHKTTNLACINSTKLKDFPVPVPDIWEQEQIVSVLKACDEKIRALEVEIKLHDELKETLVGELLSGRLPVTPLLDSNNHQRRENTL